MSVATASTAAPSRVRGTPRWPIPLAGALVLVVAAHLLAIVAWYAAPEIVLEPDLFVIGGGVGLAWIAALAAWAKRRRARRE